MTTNIKKHCKRVTSSFLALIMLIMSLPFVGIDSFLMPLLAARLENPLQLATHLGLAPVPGAAVHLSSLGPGFGAANTTPQLAASNLSDGQVHISWPMINDYSYDLFFPIIGINNVIDIARLRVNRLLGQSTAIVSYDIFAASDVSFSTGYPVLSSTATPVASRMTSFRINQGTPGLNTDADYIPWGQFSDTQTPQWDANVQNSLTYTTGSFLLNNIAAGSFSVDMPDGTHNLVWNTAAAAWTINAAAPNNTARGYNIQTTPFALPTTLSINDAEGTQVRTLPVQASIANGDVAGHTVTMLPEFPGQTFAVINTAGNIWSSPQLQTALNGLATAAGTAPLTVQPTTASNVAIPTQAAVHGAYVDTPTGRFYPDAEENPDHFIVLQANPEFGISSGLGFSFSLQQAGVSGAINQAQAHSIHFYWEEDAQGDIFHVTAGGLALGTIYEFFLARMETITNDTPTLSPHITEDWSMQSVFLGFAIDARPIASHRDEPRNTNDPLFAPPHGTAQRSPDLDGFTNWHLDAAGGYLHNSWNVLDHTHPLASGNNEHYPGTENSLVLAINEPLVWNGTTFVHPPSAVPATHAGGLYEGSFTDINIMGQLRNLTANIPGLAPIVGPPGFLYLFNVSDIFGDAEPNAMAGGTQPLPDIRTIEGENLTYIVFSNFEPGSHIFDPTNSWIDIPNGVEFPADTFRVAPGGIRRTTINDAYTFMPFDIVYTAGAFFVRVFPYMGHFGVYDLTIGGSVVESHLLATELDFLNMEYFFMPLDIDAMQGAQGRMQVRFTPSPLNPGAPPSRIINSQVIHFEVTPDRMLFTEPNNFRVEPDSPSLNFIQPSNANSAVFSTNTIWDMPSASNINEYFELINLGRSGYINYGNTAITGLNIANLTTQQADSVVAAINTKLAALAANTTVTSADITAIPTLNSLLTPTQVAALVSFINNTWAGGNVQFAGGLINRITLNYLLRSRLSPFPFVPGAPAVDADDVLSVDIHFDRFWMDGGWHISWQIGDRYPFPTVPAPPPLPVPPPNPMPTPPPSPGVYISNITHEAQVAYNRFRLTAVPGFVAPADANTPFTIDWQVTNPAHASYVTIMSSGDNNRYAYVYVANNAPAQISITATVQPYDTSMAINLTTGQLTVTFPTPTLPTLPQPPASPDFEIQVNHEPSNVGVGAVARGGNLSFYATLASGTNWQNHPERHPALWIVTHITHTAENPFILSNPNDPNFVAPMAGVSISNTGVLSIGHNVDPIQLVVWAFSVIDGSVFASMVVNVVPPPNSHPVDSGDTIEITLPMAFQALRLGAGNAVFQFDRIHHLSIELVEVQHTTGNNDAGEPVVVIVDVGAESDSSPLTLVAPDITQRELEPPRNLQLYIEPNDAEDREQGWIDISFDVPLPDIREYINQRRTFREPNSALNPEDNSGFFMVDAQASVYYRMFISQNLSDIMRLVAANPQARATLATNIPNNIVVNGPIAASNLQVFEMPQAGLTALRQQNMIMLQIPLQMDLPQALPAFNQVFTIEGLDNGQQYFVVIDSFVEFNHDQIDTSYSTPSNIAGIVTWTELTPPDPEDIIPPSPADLRIHEDQDGNLLLDASSVTISWEDIPPLTPQGNIQFEIVRVAYGQLPAALLNNRELTATQFWTQAEQAGSGVVPQAAIRTNGTGQAVSVLHGGVAAGQFNFSYEDNRLLLTNSALTPNTLYFYYVRTVWVVNNEIVSRSIWQGVSVTTAIVEGPTNLQVVFAPLISGQAFTNYDPRSQFVIRFDAPLGVASNFNSLFRFEYSLMADTYPWTGALPLTAAMLLSGPTLNPDGTYRFYYLISGLASNTQYGIRVRMWDTQNAAASQWSNIATTRTDFDQDDYFVIRDRDNINNYLRNLLLEGLGRHYWVIQNNPATNIFAVVYRPSMVNNLMDISSSMVHLTQQLQDNAIFYLPQSLFLQLWERDRGLIIAKDDMEIAIPSRAINMENNDAIIEALRRIRDVGGVEDYYVRIMTTITEHPEGAGIHGRPLAGSQVNINVDIVETSQVISQWDANILNLMTQRIENNHYTNVFAQEINNMVSSGASFEFMVRRIHEIAEQILAQMASDINNLLFASLGRVYESNYLATPIEIRLLNQAASAAVNGYQFANGLWVLRDTLHRDNMRVIRTSVVGIFAFTGFLASFPGLSAISGHDALTTIILRYNLDDFLGEGTTFDLDSIATLFMVQGVVARLAGAPSGANNAAWLREQGIHVPARGQNAPATTQEAIHLIMSLYEIRTNTSIDTLRISNFAATASITGIDPRFLQSIRAAFELNIYNNNSMTPNSAPTVYDIIKMIEAINRRTPL